MRLRKYTEKFRLVGKEEKGGILRKVFGSAMSQSPEEK